MKLVPIVLLLMLLGSCQNDYNTPLVKAISGSSTLNSQKVVIIQPFDQFPEVEAIALYNELRKVYSDCKLNASIPFPKNSYYPPRQRHRADSLIRWLSKRAKSNETIVGITIKDISTTKGIYPDFGIMGLGFRPGNACIASSFRLKNKQNFFKIIVHELGHTTGLQHCPNPNCYMQDAKGGDPTGNENGFCPKCKNLLRKMNWKL